MSDTTARDLLAQIISVHIDCDVWGPKMDCGMDYPSSDYMQFGAPEHLADAILAAGFRPPARVVTTVEELDALPDGTVIRDVFGETWTLYEGLDDGIDPDDPTNYRWAIGLNGNFPTYVTDLPATVLYEPKGGQ